MELHNVRVVAKDKSKPISDANCEVIANGHRVPGAKSVRFDDYGKGLRFVTITFLAEVENEIPTFPVTLDSLLEKDSVA